MQCNPFILLWLEAPLQSWGASSLFDRRASLDFPTRSGVLGLVLAALGAGGKQKDLLAHFAPLPQTVIAYARKERIKSPPLLQLCDFHMVGNGYDEKDAWQKLHIPKTTEGKAAVGGGAKLTYRYYIQDAAFAVVLEVPHDIAENLSAALQFPCWDTALGRRSCVPVEFVFQGLFQQEDEAIKKAASLAEKKQREESFRVCEGLHAGEEFVLSDVPIQFGPRKLYKERMVTLIHPSEPE